MIVSPIKLFLRSGRSLHFMWASYKSTVLHLSLVYPPFLSVFSYKFAGCIKLSIPSQAIAKNDRVADGIKTGQSLIVHPVSLLNEVSLAVAMLLFLLV